MNQELEYLRAKVKELQKAYKVINEAAKTRRCIIELQEENEGRHKEEIRLLKNQLHSNGKKPKFPKKPELDWNQKMRLIQDSVPEYQWDAPMKELEKLFSVFCLARWKGAQKAYEKLPKGKKPEAMPANIITFPSGGGAQ